MIEIAQTIGDQANNLGVANLEEAIALRAAVPEFDHYSGASLAGRAKGTIAEARYLFHPISTLEEGPGFRSHRTRPKGPYQFQIDNRHGTNGACWRRKQLPFSRR